MRLTDYRKQVQKLEDGQIFQSLSHHGLSDKEAAFILAKEIAIQPWLPEYKDEAFRLISRCYKMMLQVNQ
jgi:hypothetical protein